MNAKISILAACFELSVVLGLLYFGPCLAEDAHNRGTVAVVYATKDIPAGNAIDPRDLEVRNVAKTQLPSGVVSSKDAHDAVTPFYLSSIHDAAGRISLGIDRDQALFFKYPGFRGTTVIYAKKDILAGALVKDDDLVQLDSNPWDMVAFSLASKAEAIGKVSWGIAEGQVVAEDDKEDGRIGLGGIPSLEEPGNETVEVVYSKVLIPKGATVLSRYLQTKSISVHSFFASVLAREKQVHGRTTKYRIEPGQFLRKDDVR